MPPLASKLDFINVQDYLVGEKEGTEKYEYVQSHVYAMADATLKCN